MEGMVVTILALHLSSLQQQARPWPRYSQQAYLSLPTPNTSSSAHKPQGQLAAKGSCIAGPLWDWNNWRDTYWKFPTPQSMAQRENGNTPPIFLGKGSIDYPKGQLQVCHTSRDCVGAPGEYRSSVIILALALGLYTAPWYLLERGLSTHLEHQFLPLSPMDISTSPALGASKGYKYGLIGLCMYGYFKTCCLRVWLPISLRLRAACFYGLNASLHW